MECSSPLLKLLMKGIVHRENAYRAGNTPSQTEGIFTRGSLIPFWSVHSSS
jgi:hypothetical protein